jgi:hypothetical protein
MNVPGWLRQYPHAILSSGGACAMVMLPDARGGFYRASRFEWSGMVARVACGRHEYFGPWRIPHDPRCYEHGIGTAEEFGLECTPPGFRQADVNDTFLKIGVGLLRKTPMHQREYPEDNGEYSFRESYPLAGRPTWEVATGQEWVSFEQQASSGRGHAYSYRKQVELSCGGACELRISRVLRNIGAERLQTRHYGHNFISIDDAMVGPCYRVELPFTAQVAEIGGGAAVRGRRVEFACLMPPRVPAWARLTGFDRGDARHNQARVSNTRTGGWVSVATDVAPCMYNFFAERTAVCPEGFVQIDLPPGREMNWNTVYTFGD